MYEALRDEGASKKKAARIANAAAATSRSSVRGGRSRAVEGVGRPLALVRHDQSAPASRSRLLVAPARNGPAPWRWTACCVQVS